MSFNNEIDAARIPRHVAIIMDGNGRWAKAKGLPRTAGHHIIKSFKHFAPRNITCTTFTTLNGICVYHIVKYFSLFRRQSIISFVYH